MSAASVLPQRTCWMAVRGPWLRSVCNSCRILCLRAPEPAQSSKILPPSSTWSRGTRVTGYREFYSCVPCHRGELEKRHTSDEEKTSFEKVFCISSLYRLTLSMSSISYCRKISGLFLTCSHCREWYCHQY